MQNERLTPERIRRFECPPDRRQAFLWDTVAPRLAVRATAGAKAYIFESKFDRRTLRMTIGDVRAWNLEDARNEARRLQTLVDQGIDPRQERAERREKAEAAREEAQRASEPALSAWNDYLAARAPKWSARTLLDHQSMSDPGGKPKTRGRKKGEGDKTEAGILAALLARPLQEIDGGAVRAFLQTEAKTRPTRARGAFAYLRAFLNWCAEQPQHQARVHSDACASRTARDELPRPGVKDDCLQREQLALWFEHVRQQPTVAAAYLQVLLLTGARREEIGQLRWDDVDFRWRSLRIRDKVEGERVIPLTPYVTELLRGLKARNDTPPPATRILQGRRIDNDLTAWQPSPWVFSSKTSASGRMTEPRIAHNRALASAGLPDLSLHGLRRSFGTLAEWVECPAGVSAQIMGHKPSALAEKHYRRRPLDLLRMWHTKIEGWILAEAGIEQPHQKEEAAPALRVVGD